MIHTFQAEHAEYLRDESRSVGQAESISFPRDEAEVIADLHALAASRLPITIQGGRTGITAAAVPRGGHLMNLSRMDAILGMRRDVESDSWWVTVQPGVVLSSLREFLARGQFRTDSWDPTSLEALAAFRNVGPLFFPPDPTETTATIGGMLACNASGACSFRYGPMRNHVESIRVALADGSVVELRRGEQRAHGRSFRLPLEDGRVLEGMVPEYAMPTVKHAAGYYAVPDMDLLDLFIGSEGTLGIITQAELRLSRRPLQEWGVMAWLPDEAASLRLVHRLRRESRSTLAALEYFDADSLNLLREKCRGRAAFADLPELPEVSGPALYAEYHANEEAALDEALELLLEAVTEEGGDADAIWLGSDEAGRQRLHAIRHAVPEAVNAEIADRQRQTPGLVKLGTDMAVPGESLDRMFALYRERLGAAKLESVIFGHIGDNHVHVNILPHSLAEYEEGRRIYLDWAREAVRMGGTVSAEHGIGKLKTEMLKILYGAASVQQMRAVKRVFDPNGCLSRGNLFVWEEADA